jgi:hypothetical protein
MTSSVSQAILKAVAVCIIVLGALFASSAADAQQPTTCYCICASTAGLWGELHVTEPRGCAALVGKSCRVLDRFTRGVSPGRTINCGPAAFGTAGLPPR